MRLAASTALILAACQSGSGDAFPVATGGGDDTQITPAPDGPPADASGDGAASISGRVCVVADLRNLTSCTTGDASGITVTLGTSTAVTATDGSFTIATPQGSNLVWSASASDLVPTVMPLGIAHLLPIVTAARYNEMLLDNGVILQAGQGSVFARVIRNGAPAAGVTATVDPPSLYGPLYDGSSAILWERDATAAGGVVWIPDAPQGTATLTVTAPAATAVMVSVPVADGATTFATVAIP
jgi:hypothetical protein